MIWEVLQTYCETQFDDFRLLKGLFKDTLAEYHSLLSEYAPAFVRIECDYYSSTMEVLDGLPLDKMPHGCIFYFDDAQINFWSDKTGELRAVAEVNRGRFGDHIQLTEYPMWLETGNRRHYKQVYRLVNLEDAHQRELNRGSRPARVRTKDSRVSPL